MNAYQCMEARTNFELIVRDGVVRCYSGCLVDFVKDITEYILPILGDSVKAEFNCMSVRIYYYDSEHSIIKKFNDTMGTRGW